MQRDDRRTRLGLLAAALAIAALVGAGLLVVYAADLRVAGETLIRVISSVDAMEEAVAEFGAFAPLASMLLMVLHSFLPFPAEMLAVVNGMLFGFAAGLAVTWAGAMLGAYLAFGLARLLGKAFVHRMVGAERWRTIEAWTAGHGVKALLLARLTPVISFNLVNYAAGLAGVGWWTFSWTTAIGILPVCVVSVLLGSHMTVIPGGLWAVLVAAIVVVTLLHWRHRRS